MTPLTDPTEKIPIWRDDRFWRIALQGIVLVIVVAIGLILLGNMNRNLQQLGRQFDFSFLQNRAGFNIGESVVPYETNDTYFWAFCVGFLNTLRLVLVSLIVTTILGVVAGIASFSDNWLVQKISWVYVEISRNIPPLLQLFFWYFVIFFGLSQGATVTQLPGSILISKKGIVIPWPANTSSAWLWLAVLGVMAIVAVLVWRWRIKLMEEQSASGKPQQYTLIGLGIIGLLIFLFGLGWQFPQVAASGNVEGGLRMSLEYGAMVMGLAFYTGGFVAEVVRGGIQSVSKGQWEAAEALGLRSSLLMRLVVLPQALRVIIPSLNSQYINLAKNSVLAVAIGYPDFFATGLTTQNQTGRAVEFVLLLMVVYLSMTLSISLIMNQFNRLVQIRER